LASGRSWVRLPHGWSRSTRWGPTQIGRKQKGVRFRGLQQGRQLRRRRAGGRLLAGWKLREVPGRRWRYAGRWYAPRIAGSRIGRSCHRSGGCCVRGSCHTRLYPRGSLRGCTGVTSATPSTAARMPCGNGASSAVLTSLLFPPSSPRSPPLVWDRVLSGR
jgi:hypothetical protein